MGDLLGALPLRARPPKPWHFDESKGRDWLRSHNLITLAVKAMALVSMALSGSSPRTNASINFPMVV